jgi:thiol-disulfide isomerase/thioredoxin
MSFFMKPNCGLCLEAKTRLEQIASRVPIDIQEIDISKPENKNFHDVFLFDTPIGYIGDKEIFRHKVDEAEVEAVLRKTIDVEPIEVKRRDDKLR